MAQTRNLCWLAKLPDGFLLSAKAPRWLTHVKNLKEPEPRIERIEAGWLALGDKQAILLVQLSPRFACNYDRLANFLNQMLRWIRLAVEFRHSNWHTEAIINSLFAAQTLTGDQNHQIEQLPVEKVVDLLKKAGHIR